jgi:GNAT superfamily N-acetyltransferase
MSSIEIHPLSDLRDEAVQLLSERFARQRAAEPLLPEIDDFAAHVPDEEGVIATRGIDLAHAATLDDVRGSGVGLALTHHAFAWAHEQGFRSMTTDWRAVNLLSSRFWPKRGFRPQYLRLYRAIP